jgi:hypothetical protein
MACYGTSFTSLYAAGISNSANIQRASMICYGDSFTFVYAEDVRNAQEIHIRASTASYGDRFTCYM